ncbi:MAG: hypothetical protein H6R04_2084 [Burkholderiaceae bacterium]|nr:hypothetical protein [Burkholderiaceae bacterium]
MGLNVVKPLILLAHEQNREQKCNFAAIAVRLKRVSFHPDFDARQTDAMQPATVARKTLIYRPAAVTWEHAMTSSHGSTATEQPLARNLRRHCRD